MPLVLASSFDGQALSRRGFLTGLGALLTTSALVKPALPSGEFTLSIISDGGYSYSDDGTYFPARCYEGTIGRWLGIAFVENDELRFERIDPSDLYE